jgi:hypothetical protein
MRSSITSVLLLLALGTVAGGVAAAGPIGPGGKIGTMTVVRGEVYEADLNIFNVCNPVILKPGRYHRSCSVPRVHRMFIGNGLVAPTRKGLDELWKRTRWGFWVDGRSVRLAPFGAFDRSVRSFGPSGKPAFVRIWKVILVGARPGKHAVRYLTRYPGGTIDATWTVTVQK